MTSADPTTTLLEVAVEGYKGLESIRLPWSPRTVLYGENGVGKTNLLEAIALACGTRATMWQLVDRVDVPEPGAISMVVQSTRRLLPTCPDASLGFFDLEAGSDDPFHDIVAAAQFWVGLGIERGDSWSAAMWSGELHADVARALSSLEPAPIVRYSLEELRGVEAARQCDRGGWVHEEEGRSGDPDQVAFDRRFGRTLCLPLAPPEALVERAESLPDAFAPFRRWLDEPASTRSRYPELLELSPSSDVPVQLTWLSRERTTGEAWFDLEEAWDRAVGPTGWFLELLDELPLRVIRDHEPGMADVDAEWWLTTEAARAIEGTLDGVGLRPRVRQDDLFVASIEVVLDETSGELVGRLNDRTLFDRLSAGERTWVDVASLHAAADLDRLAATNRWRAEGVTGVSDDDRLDVLAAADEALVLEHGESSWAPDDLRLLGSAIDRIVGTAEDFLERNVVRMSVETPLAESVMVAGYESLRRSLVPTLQIHAFDEPERHLHPAAQRRVAEWLNRTSLAWTVVATHSHLFLGGDGWNHVHLQRVPEGVVARAFDPAELTVSDAISTQMGLSRGELLAFVRYVLIVEGIVDEIILNELYDLRQLGILVLPLHGVDEVRSLVELRFVGEMLDVGVGLLVDHSRPGVGGKRRPGTKEEHALDDLRSLLKGRGRQIDPFGLDGIDILTYLDDDVIRRSLPSFPGWKAVEVAARQGQKGLKDTVADLTGRHVGRHLVREVARTMAAEHIPASGDLPRVVGDIVAAANRSSEDRRP